MVKNTVNITQYELKQIIKETIKEVLFENDTSINSFSYFSNIPLGILKKGYRDLRLTPKLTSFGDKLSSPIYIKEAYGDIMSPDEVVRKIRNRYLLPEEIVQKTEAFNKVYVYVVVGWLGINDKLIEEDMSKLGYFLGSTRKFKKVEDMEFIIMQFEPMCQLQDDITNDIKGRYSYLYHWTPSYLVESILKEGLKPLHKNKIFNYPPRIYLMRGDSTSEQLYSWGQTMCYSNISLENDYNYTLLKINIDNLGENIRFFNDPNADVGIYTEQSIPSNVITVLKTIQFQKLTL